MSASISNLARSEQVGDERKLFCLVGLQNALGDRCRVVDASAYGSLLSVRVLIGIEPGCVDKRLSLMGDI